MLGYDPFILLNSYLGQTPSGLSPDLLTLFKAKSLLMPAEMSFPMRAAFVPSAVVMVGCGGTGSELLPKILQFLVARQKTYNEPVPPILIIDGDMVEEKNVSRQRFTSQDVGKNKAEVLSERYSDVFGVQITSLNTYIEPKTFPSALKSFWAASHENGTANESRNFRPLIIGAVDNNRARLAIQAATMIIPSIWIDAGNEKDYGQAMISYSPNADPEWFRVKDMSRQNAAGRYYFVREHDKMDYHVPACLPVDLPNFFEYYPEEFLKIPKDPLTPAGICAQHVVDNPQTIQANTYSANAAFVLITQAFDGLIRTSKICFDSVNGGAVGTPVSLSSIEEGFAKIKSSKLYLNKFFKGISSKKTPGNKARKDFCDTLGFNLEEWVGY